MSSKKEQLNIRISSELKTQLTRVSEERNLSLSDFIRTTLENAISSEEDLENRISNIEDKMDINWDKHFKRVLHAGATIANLDTDIPMDLCMATTLDTINEQNIKYSNIFSLPRLEFEKTYLGVQKRIKEKLDLSDKAISYISLLISTYNGIRFDGPIFDMSPLSVKTLQRLRIEFEKK